MIHDLAKILMGIGVGLVLLGILLYVGSGWGLGRLPGDFVFRNRHVTFYFPLATSLIISLLLTLVFYILNLFRR